MTSFKIEVIADNSGVWVSSAVRLPFREQAVEYARNLASRWTLVRQWRVAESDDAPTDTFEHGGLRPCSLPAQSMLLDRQKGGA